MMYRPLKQKVYSHCILEIVTRMSVTSPFTSVCSLLIYLVTHPSPWPPPTVSSLSPISSMHEEFLKMLEFHSKSISPMVCVALGSEI